MTNLSYKCPICGDWQCPGCPSEEDLLYDELANSEEHCDKDSEKIWEIVKLTLLYKRMEEIEAMERR